jgi:SAM-dependent methyltransferase
MSVGTRSRRETEAASGAAAEGAPLEEVLDELYARQLAIDPDNQYLRGHGSRASIANQVRTFDWYRPYLPARGTVLDWGCHHAPDSCLLRARFGERLELHGCDLVDSDRFQCFHAFAGISYEQLRDVSGLSYPSDYFDVVIGSGVLEHVGMDYESLKELYRILKPDGLLVLSYLPNWLSVQEWFRRVIQKSAFHRRLYGMGEAKQLLKRCGFYPFAARYHTFFWERLLASTGLPGDGRAARLASTLLPVQIFSSTLCSMARKVIMM